MYGLKRCIFKTPVYDKRICITKMIFFIILYSQSKD